jgi:hypothetical protein
VMMQGLPPRGGVRKKHESNVRVDGQEPDTRRQRRTSGQLTAKSISIKVRSVDSATVHGRRLSLPQEICFVSVNGLRLSKGGLTAEQKSAEGILGRDVGKASEALRRPKGGAMDRLSRERWPKAQTRRRGQ